MTATWRCCRACLRPIPGMTVPGRSSVWRISVRRSRCWALPRLRSTRVGSTAPRSSCRPRISLGPRRRRLRVGAPGRCRRRPPRRRGPPRRPVRPPGPPARWGMARQLRCSAHIAHFGHPRIGPRQEGAGASTRNRDVPGHFAPEIARWVWGLDVGIGRSISQRCAAGRVKGQIADNTDGIVLGHGVHDGNPGNAQPLASRDRPDQGRSLTARVRTERKAERQVTNPTRAAGPS